MDARRREVRELADGLVRAVQRVGVMLTYDREGVAALDAYVAANRVHWTDADRDRLCPQIGAFVGECLVEVYAGQWAADDGERDVGVLLPTGDTAFPITSAYNLLHDREIIAHEASLLGFFDRTGTSIARGGRRE